MNGSLVPANTKKSMLILGMFRLMPDLLIAGVGIAATIMLLLIFGNNASIWALLLCSLPMMIGVVLVLPIPNYHNTLCAIQSILDFYNGRKKYIWKGWCPLDEYKENK